MVLTGHNSSRMLHPEVVLCCILLYPPDAQPGSFLYEFLDRWAINRTTFQTVVDMIDQAGALSISLRFSPLPSFC